MGGLGGEAPQPPEAKNFENRNKTPPLDKEVFEGRWGGFLFRDRRYSIPPPSPYFGYMIK